MNDRVYSGFNIYGYPQWANIPLQGFPDLELTDITTLESSIGPTLPEVNLHG